jgi:hypothetical protein
VRRYKWLVFTNCDPDHHAEYNQWYDEIHIADLLRIPGIVKATRSNLSPFQTHMDAEGIHLVRPERIGAKFPYLAVYEFETDDPNAVLQAVKDRAGTAQMEITPYLGEVYTVLYEDR